MQLNNKKRIYAQAFSQYNLNSKFKQIKIEQEPIVFKFEKMFMENEKQNENAR